MQDVTNGFTFDVLTIEKQNKAHGISQMKSRMLFVEISKYYLSKHKPPIKDHKDKIP